VKSFGLIGQRQVLPPIFWKVSCVAMDNETQKIIGVYSEIGVTPGEQPVVSMSTRPLASRIDGLGRIDGSSWIDGLRHYLAMTVSQQVSRCGWKTLQSRMWRSFLSRRLFGQWLAHPAFAITFSGQRPRACHLLKR